MKTKEYLKLKKKEPSKLRYIYVLYDLEQLRDISYRKKTDGIFKILRSYYEYVLWNSSYITKNQNYLNEIELINKASLVIVVINKDSSQSSYMSQIIEGSYLEKKDFFIYFLDDSKKEDLTKNNNVFQKIFDNQEVIYKNFNHIFDLIYNVDKYKITFNDYILKFRNKVKIYSFLDTKYSEDFLLTFLKKIPSNKKNHKLKKIQDIDSVLKISDSYKTVLIIPLLDEECLTSLIFSLDHNPSAKVIILFEYFIPSSVKKKSLSEVTESYNLNDLGLLFELLCSNYPNLTIIGDVFYNHNSSHEVRYFNYFYSNKELINICKFNDEGKFVVRNYYKELMRKLKKKNVFVSYSHIDVEYVKKYIDDLKDLFNYNIIIDYDYFLAGDVWTEMASKLISNNKCQAVIVFNSRNYLSNSISFEIEKVKEYNKKCIIFNLDSCINRSLLEYENQETCELEELAKVLKKLKIAKNREGLQIFAEVIAFMVFPLASLALVSYIIPVWFLPKGLGYSWDLLYYFAVEGVILLFSFISFLNSLVLNNNFQKYNVFFYFVQVGISVGIYFIPNFHAQYSFLNSMLLFEGIIIFLANLIRLLKKKCIKSISIIYVLILIFLVFILLMFRL